MTHPLSIPGLWELRSIGEIKHLDWSLTIRFRRGGERCKPLGRVHSQSLKKLFQEYAVPPWLRQPTPLICKENEILGVGDLFRCSDEIPEMELIWKIPTKKSAN
jgi:tRNA(Ile)-lysidine synthase